LDEAIVSAHSTKPQFPKSYGKSSQQKKKKESHDDLDEKSFATEEGKQPERRW